MSKIELLDILYIFFTSIKGDKDENGLDIVTNKYRRLLDQNCGLHVVLLQKNY